MGRFVQFGCGLTAPEGWVNFDASPTLWLQRVPLFGELAKRRTPFPKTVKWGDIVRGLPLAHNSADAIYASHVLEHLSLSELRQALRNTRAHLKEGGVFRLVVPDLEALIRNYSSSKAADRGQAFMEASGLGLHSRSRGLTGFLRAWLGNSQHLWLWDYDSLATELTQAGFKNIRRAHYNDSRLEKFREVEMEGRWVDALGIECEK